MHLIFRYLVYTVFFSTSFCADSLSSFASYYERQLDADVHGGTSQTLLSQSGDIDRETIVDFLATSEALYKENVTLPSIAGTDSDFKNALYHFHVRWLALSYVSDVDKAAEERTKEEKSFKGFLERYDCYYDEYGIEAKLFMQRLWAFVSIYDLENRALLINALEHVRLGFSNENADVTLDLSFSKDEPLKEFLKTL
jgi:hypothetical protein